MRGAWIASLFAVCLALSVPAAQGGKGNRHRQDHLQPRGQPGGQPGRKPGGKPGGKRGSSPRQPQEDRPKRRQASGQDAFFRRAFVVPPTEESFERALALANEFLVHGKGTPAATRLGLASSPWSQFDHFLLQQLLRALFDHERFDDLDCDPAALKEVQTILPQVFAQLIVGDGTLPEEESADEEPNLWESPHYSGAWDDPCVLAAVIERARETVHGLLGRMRMHIQGRTDEEARAADETTGHLETEEVVDLLERHRSLLKILAQVPSTSEVARNVLGRIATTVGEPKGLRALGRPVKKTSRP